MKKLYRTVYRAHFYCQRDFYATVYIKKKVYRVNSGYFWGVKLFDREEDFYSSLCYILIFYETKSKFY